MATQPHKTKHAKLVRAGSHGRRPAAISMRMSNPMGISRKGLVQRHPYRPSQGLAYELAFGRPIGNGG